jgi:peptidoglycan hydrolase-like protein with peptidoglycan-binding domain
MRLPLLQKSGRYAMAGAVAALALACGGVARADTAASSTSSTRDVSYHGYHLNVPRGWPVIDLDGPAPVCARLDRDVVYLGHPTDRGQATCPAHLVGRTNALIVEPLDTASARLVDAHTLVADGGAVTGADAGQATGPAGQVRVEVPAAGVLITASFGTDDRTMMGILSTGHVDAQARAVRPVAAAGAATAASTAGTVPAQPGTYTGKGFDACATPSASDMQAWTGTSPYQSIGVYIGGDSRACAQPNLTSSWVGAETSAGWHILPIEVDLQAPCSSFGNRVSYTLSTAASQGTATADDAVANASALGLPAGSVLYDDMESYNTTNGPCNTAVLTFLSSWSSELHAKGYLSGVYSSVGGGIAALAAQYSTETYTMPDHIWFAWWNGAADTNTGSYVPAADWANHQRIHQYAGGANQTYGGVTINVDGDFLDVAGSGTGGGQNCSTVSLDYSAYATLSEGASGGQVSAAQCLLTAQGYFAGTVDGTFGPDTTAAVQSFQSAVGLTATGTIDSHTWTALLAAGTTPTLKYGATGTDVKRLQRALNAAVAQALVIDGDFGGHTQSAVQTYQSQVGLSADGIVGPMTWGALQAGR